MVTDAEASRLFKIALAGAFAVTLVRIVVLIFSPLELYPDEAQYWWWAQSLSPGYFSKPPLIALIVWLTTTLFGSGEWAIKLASPLLHGATSLLLFGIARIGYSDKPRVALWSTLAYLTLPGVSFSSGIISTDVPLLFFWAIALFAFLRALDDPSWRWPLLCGAALGLGLLAKYAMLYFVIGAAVAALLSPPARRLAFSLRGLAVIVIAAAILSPNIFWNAEHGFPTLAHTEANADWSHARYTLPGFFGFFAGQFGVFGPFMMAGLLAAFWRVAWEKVRANSELVLVAFCLPPLIFMLIQSFVSEANGNWAAAAYVAGTPLAVDALCRWSERWTLWASFVLNAAAMGLLWIILLVPSVADTIGAGNAFKRFEGWRALGNAVTAEAAHEPYNAVVSENRSFTAEILYYAAGLRPLIRIWDRDTRSKNHFEMTMRLTPPAARVLLVIEPGHAPDILSTFESATLKRTISIPVGGDHVRVVQLYDAHNYLGPRKMR